MHEVYPFTENDLAHMSRFERLGVTRLAITQLSDERR